MALPEPEILTANIVLVTAQAAPVEISSDEITPILKDAQLQLIPGPPGQQAAQLTSLREQTVILLVGHRMIFQDQSGIQPPKPKLAEIVAAFVNVLQSRVVFNAYGFNFDIAFDTKGTSPAAQVIMERFVKTDKLADRGLNNLRGAGLRLYYESSHAKCDLRVEPSENRVEAVRFFAHINYHYDLSEGQEIPLDTLRSDFPGKYQTFIDDVERLVIA